MMDYLWLVYSKYEYKYTMIRWTWYIVIRIPILFLVQHSILLSLDYQIIYGFLTCAIYTIYPIIDFIQFVFYARKFYLHLKSREKEIRLFYFDKEAYLDSKYIRIHFKIATILVVNALFFFTLSSYTIVLSVIFEISHMVILLQLSENLSIIFTTFVSLVTSHIPFPKYYLYLIICIYLLLLFTSHTETDRN